MRKKKIQYTKTSTLDSDEFDRVHAKVLISIRIDADVLDAVKADAAKLGEKYQPLINRLLRQHYFDICESSADDKALEAKIRKIVREEILKKAV